MSQMQPSHHKFHHPYEPYSIQLDFMQKLYECIENGNIGIFESPTGTGKSLSLICAALTWLRDNERRVLSDEGQGTGEHLDWLAQAEKDNQRRQLLEDRRELEDKLSSIRRQASGPQAQRRPTKKVRTDGQIQEQDLILDDYESDDERTSKDETALSSATLALLEKLKPAKTPTPDDIDEDKVKVIFCSRTHSQLTQFVGELSKLRLPAPMPDTQDEEAIKHVPLSSRKNLCINPKVSKLASAIAINERCLELQKPGIAQGQKCEFLPARNLPEDQERVGQFRDHAIAQIQDIEDIANLGRKMKLCPYYASRAAITSAEVLTLPYPLLLQKNAREALGVSVKDNIVIIDEAHNLGSAIADTLSVVMPLSHLEHAQKQLLGYCHRFKNKLKGKNRVYIAQIIRLLKSCIAWLQQVEKAVSETTLVVNDLIGGAGMDQIQPHKLVRYIQESKLISKVEGYAELLDELSQQQPSQHIKEKRRVQPRKVLAEFQSLLVALMNPASEGRFFAIRSDRELVLKYSLLDPQAHFRDIVQEARSVILAGGTMSPMTDWADQLFSYLGTGKLETHSFSHVIDKSNVLVQALSHGPNNVGFDFTFTNRRSTALVDELGVVVQRICSNAPGGIVVFFPSYDYLAFVTATWRKHSGLETLFSRISTLKPIFEESKEVVVDELLQSFSEAVASGNGALILAVVGGKLSEGINFSDELGRVVVCVGLPYPNIRSVEWKAKVEYIERTKYSRCRQQGLSEAECKDKSQAAGREFADNTTMRAVNQSIGRAIRHKNDYAAIYLVDKRYATTRIQAKLPAWLKDSVREGQASWEVVERDCARFFAAKSV